MTLARTPRGAVRAERVEDLSVVGLARGVLERCLRSRVHATPDSTHPGTSSWHLVVTGAPLPRRAGTRWARPRVDRVLGLGVLVLCVTVFLAYLPLAQLSVWWLD